MIGEKNTSLALYRQQINSIIQLIWIVRDIKFNISFYGNKYLQTIMMIEVDKSLILFVQTELFRNIATDVDKYEIIERVFSGFILVSIRFVYLYIISMFIVHTFQMTDKFHYIDCEKSVRF